MLMVTGAMVHGLDEARKHRKNENGEQGQPALSNNPWHWWERLHQVYLPSRQQSREDERVHRTLRSVKTFSYILFFPNLYYINCSLFPFWNKSGQNYNYLLDHRSIFQPGPRILLAKSHQAKNHIMIPDWSNINSFPKTSNKIAADLKTRGFPCNYEIFAHRMADFLITSMQTLYLNL